MRLTHFFIAGLVFCAVSSPEAWAKKDKHKGKDNAGYVTEKREESLTDEEKISICEDFADEFYCGAEIDEKLCLDNKFKRKVESVKNNPKALVAKETSLKSGKDLEFVRYDTYKVEVDGDGYHSRYQFTSYEKEGKGQPNFVRDLSCRGDGDNDD